MICMMALSYGYVTGGDSTIGEVLLYGLKPAILVIVIEATIRVARQVLRTQLMIALAALAFIATFFFDLSFVLVVIGAALTGFFAGLLGFSTVPGEMTPPAFRDAEGRRQDDLSDPIRPIAVPLATIAVEWRA